MFLFFFVSLSLSVGRSEGSYSSGNTSGVQDRSLARVRMVHCSLHSSACVQYGIFVCLSVCLSVCLLEETGQCTRKESRAPKFNFDMQFFLWEMRILLSVWSSPLKDALPSLCVIKVSLLLLLREYQFPISNLSICLYIFVYLFGWLAGNIILICSCLCCVMCVMLLAWSMPVFRTWCKPRWVLPLFCLLCFVTLMLFTRPYTGPVKVVICN